MSSSENKKRKTMTEKKKPSLVLPNDLLLSCFARLSRLYHPTLSLASKSFSSLLASPEFSETRSFLGRTETCLYLCLRFPSKNNFRWFTLCRKPNPKLNGYVITRIPILNSPLTHLSNLVAVGSNIYNIGDKTPSSSVSILDCRSHRWHEAPSMQEKRISPSVIVLDGKIYVVGGYMSYGSSFSNLMEIFDPKTQTWESVCTPGYYGRRISAGIDGKIYMFGFCCMAYNPKDGTCDNVRGCALDNKWERFCYCVIDNILYCFPHDKEFKWFDTKARLWRNVKGLETFPKIPKYSSVKVADYGGKMAVMWEEFMPSCSFENRVIRCAVISLRRRGEHEIFGKIEWLDDGVLTVPKTYEFVSVVATTV